jgi:hypothetical protein
MRHCLGQSLIQPNVFPERRGSVDDGSTEATYEMSEGGDAEGGGLGLSHDAKIFTGDRSLVQY